MKPNTKCNYLGFALLAFGALGLEVAVLTAEAFVYGSANFREWNLSAMLLHWTLTCLVWGLCTYLLYQRARKNGFDLFAFASKPSVKRIALVLLMLACCIAVSFVQWDFRWKPFAEWVGKIKTFGDGGAIAFLFQYLYYFVESVLVLLTIAFGQKFGERVFRLPNTQMIPWGGLVCGMTWGLVHILTQNLETGFTLLLLSLLYGTAYLLLQKNVRYAYFAVAFMFML